MKLKKLNLQGYKTFASKTEFIFDDGITAVVGPNGSGKSNIADAIRWVLGEQSYSSLRGKRTTDMIFAGSKKRARSGMAQATLTLDNSDGWLPLDYAEIEICRRAYRSGENEYLLNGQKVRLMDVNDLLARAGLAENTYTIIGQGLIDKALSLKSDERRILFEEAAGISHYKSKRSSTLRKLKDTRRNLERIHDILSELRPRLRSLKRQANRAQNYTLVDTDLRHLLRIWYGYQWEASKNELRLRRQESTTAEQAWQKERAILLTKQTEVDSLKSALHEFDLAQAEETNKRDEVRDRLVNHSRHVAILQERRTSLERQLKETAEDLPQLEEQQTHAKTELETAVLALQEAQADLETQQAELKTFEKSYLARQAEIKKREQTVQQWEQAQRQARATIAKQEGQLSQLREQWSEQNTAEHDDSERLIIVEKRTSLSGVITSAQQKVTEIETKRDHFRAERKQLERELGQKRRDLDDARKARNKQHTAVTRLQTRVEMLGQLRQGDQKSPQTVKVLGQLARFMTIPDRYRLAIEVALGRHIETLLVSNTADLFSLSAQKTAEQSFTLLTQDLPSLDIENRPPCLTVAVWASDIVASTEAKMAPLLGRLLSHIVLCETDEDAYQQAQNFPVGYIAVSLSGFIAHGSGLVELPRTDGKNSVLAREEAYRRAATEAEEAKTSLADLDEKVDRLQIEHKKTGRELDEINQERQRFGRLLNEASQRVNRAKQDADKLDQQESFILRQRKQQEERVWRLEKRMKGLEADITNDSDILDEATEKLVAARTQLAELPRTEGAAERQTKQQQANATRSIVDGRRAITDSRRTTLRQIDQQISRLRQRRQEWSHQLLQMNLETEEATLKTLQKELDDIESRLRPLREKTGLKQKALRQIEGEMAITQRTNHDLETRYTRAKVALTQKETHIDNLQERIKAELGIVALNFDEDQVGAAPLPLDDLVEELPLVDELPEDLEESIQKKRIQLRNMGAINPDAPAEYEEVKERHDFLEEQVADLNQTEEQLRQVIAELDILTSRAFAETVEKVDVIFGQMFTRLFGGGSAELNLTEPDDLTTTGVEIVAQLPGRRPQGLGLLSGGERSLTAASLIFALLTVSPTPFCVMDEVDAALDEANVTRFRDVLRELSIDTQFIVITHNRGTVQAAQTIYGITMGDDSTSQMISIRPDEYVTQGELI